LLCRAPRSPPFVRPSASCLPVTLKETDLMASDLKDLSKATVMLL
jgi:hypothetical protein